MRTSITIAALALLFVAPGLEAQAQISARGADIRLGGRLHSQFVTSSVDGVGSQFFQRRARLITDVTVGDVWSARVQGDFSGGSTELVDAWIRYNFSSSFRVSVGQFHRAFDLFERTSSTRLSVIERDGRVAGAPGCTAVGGVCTLNRLTSKLAYGGRDQGVRVEINGDRLSFVGTVTNGTGTNEADENGAKSLAGRVEFAASDDVTVGGAISRHDYVSGDDTEYGTAWTADVQFGGWQDGFMAQASVSGGDNWKVTDSPSFMGWMAIASYYAPISEGRIQGIEPVLRVSAGDPNTDVDDDGGFVFTPGLMMYVGGRNKFGFNVDVYSPQGGDTEYSLKFQSFLYF